MQLSNARVLITGATGGIGAATAREILQRGGEVMLTGRNQKSLTRLAGSIDSYGELTRVVPADITRADDRTRVCEAARQWGANVLINNAGIAGFGLFVEATAEQIEQTFRVNALAPMHLCRAMLPHLLRQPQAHIVNVGSVFGAIAYPGHTVYSATKFALRGFSEALRRELGGSSVRVHYLAPRATSTQFNSSSLQRLNARFGIAVDSPERVATALCRMLERNQADAVIGWPEKLFARVNAILPRVVDRSLAKQLPAIEQAARSSMTPTLQHLTRKAT